MIFLLQDALIHLVFSGGRQQAADIMSRVNAGPFLDLRSPLGVTPAALKTLGTATPAQTPEPSPPGKQRRGAQPGMSAPQPKRALAIKGGGDHLPLMPSPGYPPLAVCQPQPERKNTSSGDEETSQFCATRHGPAPYIHDAREPQHLPHSERPSSGKDLCRPSNTRRQEGS